MDGGSQNGAYDGRVMTEEQMEILSKQIAIYAAICGQLVSLHESLSSKLPLSSGTTWKHRDQTYRDVNNFRLRRRKLRLHL